MRAGVRQARTRSSLYSSRSKASHDLPLSEFRPFLDGQAPRLGHPVPVEAPEVEPIEVPPPPLLLP